MLDIGPQRASRRAAAPTVDWRRRRQQIVERVTDLYLERPWINISIETVAERAGLSFWQVYHSFDGQEDVYRAVVGRLLASIEVEIDAAPRASDTVRATIVDYVDCITTLYLSDDYRGLVFLELRDGPSEPWLAMNVRCRIRKRIRTGLESRIAAAGRRHGLSIVCDGEILERSLAALEANTALTSLLVESVVQDRTTETAKAKVVTDIWRAARNSENTVHAIGGGSEHSRQEWCDAEPHR